MTKKINTIPPEKLTTLDIKYIHLLFKEIPEEKDVAFADILRAEKLKDIKTGQQNKNHVNVQLAKMP